MSDLSHNMQRVLTLVEKSYRYNYPLEQMGLTPAQIQRVDMCTQVAKRLQDNPLMNVSQFLEKVFGRTSSEIMLDKKLIAAIRNLRYGTDDRDTAGFIAESMAKKLMQIGVSMGDPKWIDKGLSQYIRTKQLDQPAPQDDLMDNTQSLPIAFTPDIQQVDPNRTSLTTDARRALMKEWGASDDEISVYIDQVQQKMLSSNPDAVAVEYPDGDVEIGNVIKDIR